MNYKIHLRSINLYFLYKKMSISLFFLFLPSLYLLTCTLPYSWRLFWIPPLLLLGFRLWVPPPGQQDPVASSPSPSLKPPVQFLVLEVASSSSQSCFLQSLRSHWINPDVTFFNFRNPIDFFGGIFPISLHILLIFFFKPFNKSVIVIIKT